MDKQTFVAICQKIVEGFEDPAFQQQFADAQASGDVAQMMALPARIQDAAFSAHGCPDSATFKAAGKQHAMDPDVGALLVRMKQALKG